MIIHSFNSFIKPLHSRAISLTQYLSLSLSLSLLLSHSLLKLMEDPRKYKHRYEIVSQEKRLKKVVNKANFDSLTLLTNGVVLCKSTSSCIKFERPIQVAATILDNSKLLNYKFYYTLQKTMANGGWKTEIQLQDTDSFLSQKHSDICFQLKNE